MSTKDTLMTTKICKFRSYSLCDISYKVIELSQVLAVLSLSSYSRHGYSWYSYNQVITSTLITMVITSTLLLQTLCIG